jgi:hypothetical protein
VGSAVRKEERRLLPLLRCMNISGYWECQLHEEEGMGGASMLGHWCFFRLMGFYWAPVNQWAE